MKALLFVLLLSCANAFAETTTPLFVIKRSLNANEVHYDLNLVRGEIDPVNPMSVYWILNAKDGSREELSGLERRKAYGYKVQRVAKDSIQFSLIPLKKDVLTVKKNAQGKFVVTLPINGKESILDVVFVETGKGGPIPPVKRLELRGRSLSDDAPVLEQRKFQ